MDMEEQRRSAEAHEAHMKMVMNDSLSEWERQESQRLQEVLRESSERQVREMSSHMTATMETSRMEYSAYMEASYGEYVEEGSSGDQAIKRKSMMDWHHPKWTTEEGIDELLRLRVSRRRPPLLHVLRGRWQCSSPSPSAATAATRCISQLQVLC